MGAGRPHVAGQPCQPLAGCAVVEDACFDRSEASHAVTLYDLNCKYADVVTTDEAVAHAQGLPDDLFPNLPG